MSNLQLWLTAILADPITKMPCKPEEFKSAQGVIDARVFLKNTHGYSDWAEGQHFYEEEFSGKDVTTAAAYQAELNYDRPIYQHFPMAGRILDVGGGQEVCASFFRQRWNLFPLTLGCRHPLPSVTTARRRIPA